MSAVAFDLDGCLIDSRAGIFASVRVALVSKGLPALPDDDLAFLIGPPLGTGMAELLRRMGEDPERAEELVAAYRADYRRTMLDTTTLYPGMDEAVRRIAEHRTLCVVTSKPQPLAEPIVAHLGLLTALAFVEGPALDAPEESKKVTLGRAIERLPDLAVMIGDRHHDIDAGRAYGLRTIGVTWGIGGRDELAGADLVVDTPDELVEAVLR